jgi:hypothetical protein
MFMEKQMQGCNDNIMTNYEKQLKHEFDMRARRDQMLKDI